MFKHKFKFQDQVVKSKGDYIFVGEVRSVFTKKSGVVRYVVENMNGVLMIMNEDQLRKIEIHQGTERCG